MSYGSFPYGSSTYGGSILSQVIAYGLSNKKRPKVLIRYGRMNQPIRVPIYDLLLDQQSTFQIEDQVAGATTLVVENIERFTTNQFLLIGTEGIETTEIVQTSSSVSPTGHTITLNAPLKFAHNSNTVVTIIDFNQIEYSWSLNLDGPKTVLTTLAIQGKTLDTNYNETQKPNGYYFARWYNALTQTYSPYSDGVEIFSYSSLMARSLIDNALGDINKEISDLITDEYAFMQINNCQEEVKRQLKVWTWLQAYGRTIGNAYLGQHRFQVPENMDDQFSPGKVYNVSVGVKPDMVWIDKAKMDSFMVSMAYSRLAQPIVVGDTTINLEHSGNFKDSGTVHANGYEVAYTANNRTTGVLTLTEPVTFSMAEGLDISENATLGTPQYWTIFEGWIYMFPFVSHNLEGRAIMMDYYQTLALVRTDTDRIQVQDPTMVQYYLQWKFMVRAQNGDESEGSLAKKELWIARLKQLAAKETIGRTFRFTPRFNNFSRQMSWYGDSRLDRLGNFPYVNDN